MHNLKCNVNPLTPDQIIFCLADMENHIFKDHRTCLLLENNNSICTKLEAIMKKKHAKLLLSIIVYHIED